MSLDPQTILDDSQAYANSLKSDVMTAYQGLLSMASSLLPSFTFSDPVKFEPTNLAPLEASDLPILKETVFDKLLTDALSDFDPYKTHVFIAPYLDSLQTKLAEVIDAGGTYINADVQEALFNQSRERDLQTYTDAVELAHAEDAEFGFPIPADTFFARDAVLLKNYTNTRTDRNKEITVMIADLTFKSVVAASESQVSIETLHSGFALGFSKVVDGFKTRILDKARLELDARLGEYNGKLSGIVAGYQVLEANGRQNIAYMGLLEEKWKTELTNLTERGRLDIVELQEKTKIRLGALGAVAKVAGDSLEAALKQTSGISFVKN
jgi:hypothetical protein